MSEFLQNEEKQEKLKQIVKRLHAGATVHDLKEEFAELLEDLSAEEIAAMEQSLVDEGFPPSSIQDLCEVHVEVFEDSLKKAKDEAQVDGHAESAEAADSRELIRSKIRELFTFEKHYQRKENQLFPKLEAKGFTGPTTVRWGKHDEIRDAMKELRRAIGDDSPASEIKSHFKALYNG